MAGVVEGLVFGDEVRAGYLERGRPLVRLGDQVLWFAPASDLTAAPDAVVPGFVALSQSLAHEASAASLRGPVLYVQLEFFGGHGTHEAVGWHRQQIAFGPVFTATASEAGDQHLAVESPGEMAINAGLRWLGVMAAPGRDEFATIGLDRYRWTTEWISAAARQG